MGALLAATLVLLPFENLSGAEQARGDVTALVAAAIADRGYAVVSGAAVEPILEGERVRYLDSLAEPARRRLLADLEAQGVVSGTVYTYLDGDNPIAAFSVRLTGEDGRVAWWRIVGLSASDTAGMFGHGRPASLQALARKAADQLLRDFPAPGAAAPAERPRSRPFRLPPPRTFRAAALEKGHVHRICVLPLENATPAKGAGQVVTQLLWRRLTQTGSFEVVEPAEFRAAMVAERIASFRDMDPERLRTLGRRCGTSLFLRGTLWTWREGSPRGSKVSPQAALELSLVDVDTGRILWTSQHARAGDDYEFLLRRGAVTNAVSLADRLVSEMVADEEDAEPPRTQKIRTKGQGAP